MELVINNRQGKKLFCLLDFPFVRSKSLGGPSKVKKQKYPAVIFVHGFKGDSNQKHIRAIAKTLNNVGIVTIRPDLTNTPGRSYLDFAKMTYRQELLDLEDIYKWVLKRDDVDAGQIGIMGHSLGGMLAAEIASMYPKIKVVVTLSAVFDFRFLAKKLFNKLFKEVKKDFREKGWSTVWSKSLKRELHIGKQFYEDVITRSASNFADKIRCPVLIVSSGNDESVSQSHRENYLKSIESVDKELRIISGADHNYTKAGNLEEVCGIVSVFFSKKLHLKTGTVPV